MPTRGFGAFIDQRIKSAIDDLSATNLAFLDAKLGRLGADQRLHFRIRNRLARAALVGYRRGRVSGRSDLVRRAYRRSPPSGARRAVAPADVEAGEVAPSATVHRPAEVGEGIVDWPGVEPSQQQEFVFRSPTRGEIRLPTKKTVADANDHRHMPMRPPPPPPARSVAVASALGGLSVRHDLQELHDIGPARRMQGRAVLRTARSRRV